MFTHFPPRSPKTVRLAFALWYLPLFYLCFTFVLPLLLGWFFIFLLKMSTHFPPCSPKTVRLAFATTVPITRQTCWSQIQNQNNYKFWDGITVPIRVICYIAGEIYGHLQINRISANPSHLSMSGIWCLVRGDWSLESVPSGSSVCRMVVRTTHSHIVYKLPHTLWSVNGNLERIIRIICQGNRCMKLISWDTVGKSKPTWEVCRWLFCCIDSPHTTFHH